MVALHPDEVRSLGLPSVLDTGQRLVVSDGNHRVAILFGKGEGEVNVDYTDIRELSPAYSFDIDEVLNRQKQMQRRGVASPEDSLIKYLEKVC